MKKYGVKVIIIFLILILFWIPVRLVSEIVRERERRSHTVREEVIGSWGGRASIAGPYLIVPVSRIETVVLEKGDSVQRRIHDEAIFFPETLNAGGFASSEIRTLGIFPVPVFTLELKMDGYFDLTSFEERLEGYDVDMESIRIGFSLDDLSGIRDIDLAKLGEETLSFEPSGANRALGRYQITAPVSPEPGGERREYQFSMQIGGGGSISIAPVARQTEVMLASDWHAPGFFGSALPTEHSIRDDGFTASWTISHLSRSLPSFALVSTLYEEYTDTSRFGVRFFQAEDPYPRNERSVKYAWLFLIVPFITFFLFEVVRKQNIHPIQYLLAGSADIVFYLLLLSISEHLPFMIAYGLAAGSVTLLLGAYGSTVLGGKASGTLLGGILAIAYGYLLVVLRSEDYALLLGSVGLFASLAIVMFLTRKVRWFEIPGISKG
jgi:inner membrane protein